MSGNSAASLSSVSFSHISFFACHDKCLCGSVELGASCKILSSRTTAAAFKRSFVLACKSPSQSGLWAVDIPLCMERWGGLWDLRLFIQPFLPTSCMEFCLSCTGLCISGMGRVYRLGKTGDGCLIFTDTGEFMSMLGVAFPVQLFLGHLLQVTVHQCPGSKPSKLLGTQGELWWSHISFCSWDLGKWGWHSSNLPSSWGRGNLLQTLITFSLYFFSSLAITLLLYLHTEGLFSSLFCYPLTQAFAFDAACF